MFISEHWVRTDQALGEHSLQQIFILYPVTIEHANEGTFLVNDFIYLFFNELYWSHTREILEKEILPASLWCLPTLSEMLLLHFELLFTISN